MAYGATAVADWDSTKPVGASEAVNILDDAIREIKVCVENDVRTAAQVTASGLAAAVAAVPGLVIRPKFTWKDADEIYIEPFVYYHNGTSEQLLYCDLQLTYQFGNLANSDWSYLYLDDTAIVTAATPLIAIGQMVDALTEPVWDVTDHSWMNGDDKCIFAVRTDGSGNILEFFHDGDLVLFADQIASLASTDIDTTWTDATLMLPVFTNKALVTFDMDASGDVSGPDAYWRTNGQSGTTGHKLGQPESAETKNPMVQASVIADGTQKIEVKYSAGGAHKMAVWTDGYYFGIGT